MGRLGEQLVKAGWKANDDHATVVRLDADFADSDEWAISGCSTASRWIAATLDVAPRTANEWIRIGRCLRALPALTEALTDRRLSFSKVKELTRSATPTNERDLVAIAERTPAAQLGRHIAAWLQRHEPENVIDAQQHEARSMRWSVEPDGTVLITTRLPPVEAGMMTAAVDATVMRRAGAKRRGGDEPWPSLAQQRADALVELFDTDRGGVQTEVVLHVRGDGATLDDGTPITSTAIARLVDQAFIRVLIHDAEGTPINASTRQRHPTARQKRVVKERDRVCVDCGSTVLLEYDHVPAYEDSKRTIVDELELRCSTCHTFRHQHAG